jgi:hypothetical protein
MDVHARWTWFWPMRCRGRSDDERDGLGRRASVFVTTLGACKSFLPQQPLISGGGEEVNGVAVAGTCAVWGCTEAEEYQPGDGDRFGWQAQRTEICCSGGGPWATRPIPLSPRPSQVGPSITLGKIGFQVNHETMTERVMELEWMYVVRNRVRGGKACR